MAAFSLRWINRCQMVLDSAAAVQIGRRVPSRLLVRSPIGVAIHVRVTCGLGVPSSRKTKLPEGVVALGGLVHPSNLQPLASPLHSNSRILTFKHSHLTTEPHSCCVPFQPGLAAVDALLHRIASHHIASHRITSCCGHRIIPQAARYRRQPLRKRTRQMGKEQELLHRAMIRQLRPMYVLHSP